VPSPICIKCRAAKVQWCPTKVSAPRSRRPFPYTARVVPSSTQHRAPSSKRAPGSMRSRQARPIHACRPTSMFLWKNAHFLALTLPSMVRRRLEIRARPGKPSAVRGEEGIPGGTRRANHFTRCPQATRCSLRLPAGTDRERRRYQLWGGSEPATVSGAQVWYRLNEREHPNAATTVRPR
jgi:hypothetical protein